MQIFYVEKESRYSKCGMLAAWMRMKYPNIIHSAWASSAPMIWFDQQSPIGGYESVTKNVFKFFRCDTNIKILQNAFQAINDIANSPDGLKRLNHIFHMHPKSQLKNISQVDGLISFAGDMIDSMAMTNYPYPTSFLADLPAWPIKIACEYVKQMPANPKDEELATLLYNISKIYTNNPVTCLGDCGVKSEDNIELLDVWYFMYCTDLTIMRCWEGPPNDFFPHRCDDRDSYLHTFLKGCKKTFGKIGWTEDYFNENSIKDTFGFDFNHTSRIIFTDGSFDPWSPGRLPDEFFTLDSTKKNQIFHFMIDGAAHHLDLRQPTTCDPDNLKSARTQAVNILKSWLPGGSPFEPKKLPDFIWKDETVDCKHVIHGFPW